MAGRADHLKKYWFQPGQSGNPEGRPAHPLGDKEVRRFTREHVSDVYNKIIDMTIAELRVLLKDKNVTAFEKAVAKAVINAHDTGMLGGSLENILERIIGKVPQKIEGELSGPGGIPLPAVTVVHEPVRSLEKRPDGI